MQQAPHLINNTILVIYNILTSVWVVTVLLTPQPCNPLSPRVWDPPSGRVGLKTLLFTVRSNILCIINPSSYIIAEHTSLHIIVCEWSLCILPVTSSPTGAGEVKASDLHVSVACSEFSFRIYILIAEIRLVSTVVYKAREQI